MDKQTMYVMYDHRLDMDFYEDGALTVGLFSNKDEALAEMEEVVKDYLKFFNLRKKYVVRANSGDKYKAYVNWFFEILLLPTPVDVPFERRAKK